MSGPLRVGVAPGAPTDFLAAQRSVWATLPMSLAGTSTEPAQLVAVDGRHPDWLTTASETASSGVLGVLVVRPCPGPSGVEVRELGARARDNGVVVGVETTWASHPAVAQLADAASASLADVSLVDGLTVVATDDPRSPASILLDQLALLRAVLGAVDDVAFIASGARGHTLNAHRGTTAVALAAIRSSGAAARARLTLYSGSGEAHVEVPADGTAAPARASIVDDRGESVLPSWYESASRASWRRIHDSVTKQQALSDLDSLADDLGLIAAIT